MYCIVEKIEEDLFYAFLIDSELWNLMVDFFDDFYFRYKFEIIVLNCEEFKLLNKNDMHVNLLTLLSH